MSRKLKRIMSSILAVAVMLSCFPSVGAYSYTGWKDDLVNTVSKSFGLGEVNSSGSSTVSQAGINLLVSDLDMDSGQSEDSSSVSEGSAGSGGSEAGEASSGASGGETAGGDDSGGEGSSEDGGSNDSSGNKDSDGASGSGAGGSDGSDGSGAGGDNEESNGASGEEVFNEAGSGEIGGGNEVSNEASGSGELNGGNEASSDSESTGGNEISNGASNGSEANGGNEGSNEVTGSSEDNGGNGGSNEAVGSEDSSGNEANGSSEASDSNEANGSSEADSSGEVFNEASSGNNANEGDEASDGIEANSGGEASNEASGGEDTGGNRDSGDSNWSGAGDDKGNSNELSNGVDDSEGSDREEGSDNNAGGEISANIGSGEGTYNDVNEEDGAVYDERPIVTSVEGIEPILEADIDEVSEDTMQVTVPIGIPLKMNTSGDVTIAGDLKITNESEDRAIIVTGLSVGFEDGWQGADFYDDFRSKDTDTKEIGIKFRSDVMKSDGTFELSDGNWIVPKNGEMSFIARVKLPRQTVGDKGKIGTLNLTIDWYDGDDVDASGGGSSIPEGSDWVATIEDGEHGTVDDKFPIWTDSDGVIGELPQVTPDKGYELDKWINADTGEEVREGYRLTEDITITPVFKKEDETSQEPNVNIGTSEHGTVNGEVTVDNDGKITSLPETTPDEGYVFDKWVDEDGNEVKVGDTVTDGETITPVFKKDSSLEEGQYIITALPGLHGSILGSSTLITDTSGTVPSLPSVKVDDGYEFSKWTSGETEIKAGDTITSDIVIVAQYTEVVEEEPESNSLVVSYNNGLMLPGSVNAATYKWRYNARSGVTLESAESDNSNITVEVTETGDYLSDTSVGVVSVEAESVGTAVVTGTLSNGESATFTVDVSELDATSGSSDFGDVGTEDNPIIGDGEVSNTVHPGDTLTTDDIEVTVPVVDGDGNVSNVEVKVESIEGLEDTELVEGDNEITITGDAGGVKVVVVVTITVSNDYSNVLQYVVVSKNPDKTTYYAGDDFDGTGLELTAVYGDGSTKTKKFGDEGVSIVDGTSLPLGKSYVVCSVIENGAVRAVEVPISVIVDNSKVLESISVNTNPTRTSYVAGEDFDGTGMVLNIVYADGHVVTATEGYVVVDGSDLTSGKNTVTVTYTQGDITKSTTVPITVVSKESVTPASLVITTPPTKVDYIEGDTFDAAGMSLTVTYQDGSTKVKSAEDAGVSMSWESKESGSSSDGLTTDDTSITVKYTEYGTAVEAVQAITVVSKESITPGSLTITTPPTKVDYVEGEVFDSTGMKLSVTYLDGTTVEKDVSAEGVTVDRDGVLVTSDNSITVSYEENGVKVNATQAISVVSKESITPTYLTVKTPPTKIDYTEGEAFDSTGMVLTVTYADGTTADKDVSAEGITVESKSGLTKDDTAITVSYVQNGVTVSTTQSITVKPSAYTVKFVAGTGGYVAGSTTETVDAGKTANFPTVSVNSGYYFVNWTDENGNVVNESTVINSDVTFTANFNEVTKLAVPTVTSDLIYNGSEQSPTIGEYDSSLITASYDSQTNVGDYNVTFSLVDKEKYSWNDGTTDDKTVQWSIKAVSGDVSLSESSARLYYFSDSKDITVSGADGRTVTVESSNTDLVTATVSNGVVTLKKVRASDYSDVDGTATVTVSVAGDSNHSAYSGEVSVCVYSYEPSTVVEGVWIDESADGVYRVYANGNSIKIVADGESTYVYGGDDGTSKLFDRDISGATVYGGGKFSDSVVTSTNVTLAGGTLANVYGGGAGGSCTASRIEVTGGSYPIIYAGGNGTTVGSMEVVVSGGIVETLNACGNNVSSVDETCKVSVSGVTEEAAGHVKRLNGSANAITIETSGGVIESFGFEDGNATATYKGGGVVDTSSKKLTISDMNNQTVYPVKLYKYVEDEDGTQGDTVWTADASTSPKIAKIIVGDASWYERTAADGYFYIDMAPGNHAVDTVKLELDGVEYSNATAVVTDAIQQNAFYLYSSDFDRSTLPSAVAATSDKEKYLEGDDFDSSSVVVSVTYNNGNVSVVDSGYEVLDGENLSVGTSTVLLGYYEKGVSLSTSIPVTVVKSYIINVAQTTDEDGGVVTDGVKSVSTDVDGKIVKLPGTTPATGYEFEKWIDSAGNEVTEDTVFTDADTITPVFKSSVTYVDVPVQSGSLTYTGTAQSPTWIGYDSSAMTATGVTGTNAGTYSTIFSLKSGYAWSDGTTADKEVAWSIGKAAGSVYLSPSSVSLSSSTNYSLVTATRASTGSLSAVSLDTNIATVQVSGDSITVNGCSTSGNTSVLVTVAEDTNYTSASASISVTASYLPASGKKLNEYTWDEIKMIADAGLGDEYFDVGDTKTITLNGAVGECYNSYYANYDNVSIDVFIIGFGNDYNDGITFQLGKKDNNLICFIDGNYNTKLSDLTKLSFNLTQTGSSSGGWESSSMRNELLGQNPNEPGDATFMHVLPEDLRKVMKTTKNYTDNYGYKRYADSSSVTMTEDYLFLLSINEYGEAGTGVNPTEKSMNSAYEYWDGSTKALHVAYSIQNDGTTEVSNSNTKRMVWTRTPYTNVSTSRTDYWNFIDTTGLYGNNCTTSYSLAICPAFTV